MTILYIKCSVPTAMKIRPAKQQPPSVPRTRAQRQPRKAKTPRPKRIVRDNDQLYRLFCSYVNENDSTGENRMGPHGVQRLLNDLGYECNDRRVLVLAYKFDAKTPCEFSLNEWNDGMEYLEATSVQALQRSIDAINYEMNTNRELFCEIYQFTFDYTKSPILKKMDLATAINCWDALFGVRTKVLDNWINFLKAEEQAAADKLRSEKGDAYAEGVKYCIDGDTWDLFLDFYLDSTPDLLDYDKNDAWPVLIDKFVEYCRENLGYPKPIGDEEKEYYY